MQLLWSATQLTHLIWGKTKNIFSDTHTSLHARSVKLLNQLSVSALCQKMGCTQLKTISPHMTKQTRMTHMILARKEWRSAAILICVKTSMVFSSWLKGLFFFFEIPLLSRPNQRTVSIELTQGPFCWDSTASKADPAHSQQRAGSRALRWSVSTTISKLASVKHACKSIQLHKNHAT